MKIGVLSNEKKAELLIAASHELATLITYYNKHSKNEGLGDDCSPHDFQTCQDLSDLAMTIRETLPNNEHS